MKKFILQAASMLFAGMASWGAFVGRENTVSYLCAALCFAILSNQEKEKKG